MATSSLARIGTPDQPKAITQVVQLSLAGYVRDKYQRAAQAKQVVTERLLKCERQRRGEYDPVTLAKIRRTGGSETYIMLTDIKCRAAESWLRDVMQSAGEKPYGFDPTAESSLPIEMHEQIVNEVTQAAMQAQQQGAQVTPDMIDEAMRLGHTEIAKMMKQAAQEAADAMSVHVEDILQEAKFPKTQSDLIYDFVTFPACIMKGPVVRRRKVMEWGPNWTPVVTETINIDVERVSAYDAFPSASATNCNDGDFIQRHRLKRQDLTRMIGEAGYNDEEIKKAIDQYGKNGLREITYGETEREWLSGRNTSLDSGEDIEALEFWGGANGAMLQEWGMKSVDKYTEYQVNVWLVGTFIIKAVLNPDPLGRRPYSKACFSDIPGAFWGTCPPEMMRHTQDMCNSAGRALANNMGVASGPQAEIAVDRLPDGEDVTNIHPFKIWQTTSDRTGGGQPAVRFFQPNMNSEPLMQVLQYFMKVADEITGIPNYIYGSTNVGGAGRTASGLSMLMDNASKGIKQAILQFDYALNDVLERIFYHEMIYNPDRSIKGDMRVVPAGVVGALMKDHINEKRTAFLQSTTNPTDLQILGLDGRAELLRQIAVGMQIETDGVIPDAKAIQEKMQQGGIPPEIQQQLQQLTEENQTMKQKLLNKEGEIKVRQDEIAARSEDNKVQAKSMVDARIHENEIRAHTDSDARIRAAEIAAETARYLGELKAGNDHNSHTALHANNAEKDRLQHEREVKATALEHEREVKAAKDAAATERDSARAEEAKRNEADVRKMYADLAKAISQQAPPVINITVDAASGTVKKSGK